MATQTRPDILFEYYDLLGKIKSPIIDDAKRANKLVNKIKNEETVVALKKEDKLVDSKLLVFCDASLKTCQEVVLKEDIQFYGLMNCK